MFHSISNTINWAKTWLRHRGGSGLSILVPFHCSLDQHQRAENWAWLRKHWECELPHAQIVMGDDPTSSQDPSIPFSKSAAVNDAASRAKGDIFVIIDADGLIDTASILHCAEKIREAEKKDRRLWYVPYRQFYRLTEKASRRVLQSPPCESLEFPVPPPPCDILNTSGSQHGHWYGAGIQIMSRSAFWEVGGWDERFRGWGGEDHAAMRAMDTLYWRHKTLPGQFLHIWHPMFSTLETASWVDWKDRVWENQISAGANDALSGRYYGAYGDRKRMRKLVNESRISLTKLI